MPTAGFGAVLDVFGAAAVIGGLVALWFAAETKAKVLEQVSASVRRSRGSFLPICTDPNPGLYPGRRHKPPITGERAS